MTLEMFHKDVASFLFTTSKQEHFANDYIKKK